MSVAYARALRKEYGDVDERELDDEPAWRVELRAQWEDRLALLEQLVALGEMMPERLEMDRARAAYELEHPEISGVIVDGYELTREELFDAADGHPEGCAPTHEPTPAEEAADLERARACAERRETTKSLVVQCDELPWNRVSEHARVMLDGAGVADAGRAEAAFDGRLAVSIARREVRVRALRLRGLLRGPRPLAVPCRRYAGLPRPSPRRRRPGCRARSPGRPRDPEGVEPPCRGGP